MSKVRVLLVEDEAIIAAALSLNLRAIGHEVVAQVSRGEVAIEKALTLKPDIILMDIMLEGQMDGIEAAQGIRQHSDIPIIYITAFSDLSTIERAKLADPLGYIVKPAEERDLFLSIELAMYRHRMERKLKESEAWLSTTLQGIADGVVAVDDAGLIKLLNPIAEAMTGHAPTNAAGIHLDDVLKLKNTDTGLFLKLSMLKELKEPSADDKSLVVVARDGKETPVHFRVSPLVSEKGQWAGTVVVLYDVTERRRAEAERERLIVELQEALANVKTLRGLLPICAWCKKIRNDKGYWDQTEEYVRQHTYADFTHSICPECYEKLAKELDD